MIISPRDTRYSPDIKATVVTAADMLTGDGVFADTDLIRIPYDGYLMVNAVVTGTGDSELFVPQIHHQENRSNNIPVLAAGVAPDVNCMVNYKIPVHKGDTPRVLYNEVSDTSACISGYFYRGMNRKGINNPVAWNTPDVLVFKQITATAQNALAIADNESDLEDFPLPGMLLAWVSSSGVTSTIQMMQKGHQTGNTSTIPTYAAGLACYCQYDAPFKMYVPATGNPTVTITVNNSETISLCAAFYVDWQNVSPALRARMGY